MIRRKGKSSWPVEEIFKCHRAIERRADMHLHRIWTFTTRVVGRLQAEGKVAVI